MTEEFLFRRFGFGPRRADGTTIGLGYDWDAWSDPKRLPLGLAATTSFILGWVGAILCMSQVWWTGPVGRAVKGDIGVPVAVGVAGLAYPGLRWLELKYVGR